MNFKEFLEEEAEVPENIVCQKTVEGSSSNAEYVCCPPDLSPCECKCHEEVISVKALGEWAWEQLKFHIKNTWTYKNPIALYYAIENGYSEEKTPKGLALKSAYHEIAVACLGEKNVKKRLSEMK